MGQVQRRSPISPSRAARRNLVVLDEDQAAELDKWCVAYGITLPATREVSTGRGRHLDFNWDHGKQAIGNGSKAFDGFKIDVRGKGGW